MIQRGYLDTGTSHLGTLAPWAPTRRLGFPREIPRNSRGKGELYQSDAVSATGIWQCLNDHGTENPPAEIPREVIFLAIAREFRGNGNGNRNPDWHNHFFRMLTVSGFNYPL